MKVVLMNKNTEVLYAEYDVAISAFTKVYEVYNIDYAPYILKWYYDKDDDSNTFRRHLTEWFKGRGIPSWRDNLEILLRKLNVSTADELLDKAFALSLSDQYWIKPYDLDIKYEKINFFENDFDYAEFLEASLSVNSKSIKKENSLKTPNNTTDGMLKKAWVIDNGKRYLLKGDYKEDILSPFNEVLASMICERLGFNHVSYTIDTYKDNVVSKCPCFINKDTELVSAYQIMNDQNVSYTKDDYENYIRILEKNGIENAREKVENMYILDFIIMNVDRHLNNFGIIRDVNTLKWLDVAPIFDNGMALRVKSIGEKEVVVSTQGRFFYETITFDEMIKVIRNIKRIDISKLDRVVEDYDKLLHEYQSFTKITEDSIHKTCVVLYRQINKLKEIIENS